jgi:hypothetical protein
VRRSLGFTLSLAHRRIRVTLNGSGSEHSIDGEQFAMELHLVHYNGAFADSSSALASGAKVLEDRSPCPCPGPALPCQGRKLAQCQRTTWTGRAGGCGPVV